MCKAILMMILTVVSSSAAAEWILVGGTANFVTYTDLVTLHKEGNKVKMWDLADHMPIKVMHDGKQYKSTKTQVEYDCKEKRSRVLYFAHYSGHMGEGEAVYFDLEPSDWSHPSPGRNDEMLLRFACKKR